MKSLIQQYVDGWKEGNEKKILGALADDCIIVESHGPTYRGKEIVKKWIVDWHNRGNVVEKWVITSYYSCKDLIVFEWVFAYKSKKIREAFGGVTLAKIKNRKIADLKEYRATQFPFMWQPKPSDLEKK